MILEKYSSFWNSNILFKIPIILEQHGHIWNLKKTEDDIINCIKNRGLVFATIVHDLPDNDPKKGMRPIDIDQDGLITVEVDSKQYTIDLNDVEKIEY